MWQLVTSPSLYFFLVRLADLKRDLKAKLHIAPGERDMNDYEGSLLSEEVAVNIIEDVRKAAKRCLLVSMTTTSFRQIIFII